MISIKISHIIITMALLNICFSENSGVCTIRTELCTNTPPDPVCGFTSRGILVGDFTSSCVACHNRSVDFWIKGSCNGGVVQQGNVAQTSIKGSVIAPTIVAAKTNVIASPTTSVVKSVNTVRGVAKHALATRLAIRR
jgi:hypothetical protein